MLEAIKSGRLEPIVSWELVKEIVDVLRRPRLKRYGISDDDIEALVGALSPFLPTVVVNVEMRDADDIPAASAAISGRASAIVTGDRDFLDDDALLAWLSQRGVDVLTPTQVLGLLDD